MDDRTGVSLEYVGFLLSRVASLIRSETNEALAPLGIDARTLGILDSIHRDPGIVQLDLARTRSIDPAQLVKYLDKLVDAGLMERSADPADRRRNGLFLTQHGMDILEKGAQAARSAELRTLQALSENEIAELKLTALRVLDQHPPDHVQK